MGAVGAPNQGQRQNPDQEVLHQSRKAQHGDNYVTYKIDRLHNGYHRRNRPFTGYVFKGPH